LFRIGPTPCLVWHQKKKRRERKAFLPVSFASPVPRWGGKGKREKGEKTGASSPLLSELSAFAKEGKEERGKKKRGGKRGAPFLPYVIIEVLLLGGKREEKVENRGGGAGEGNLLHYHPSSPVRRGEGGGKRRKEGEEGEGCLLLSYVVGEKGKKEKKRKGKRRKVSL